MKVTVDLAVCSGHAHCSHRCPEVFSNDDTLGKCVILQSDVPSALEADVRRAVRSCPEGALKITD